MTLFICYAWNMENSNPNPDSSGVSISEALNHIGGIRTIIARMGANDSESNALDDITRNLQKGSLTPKEALDQANQVLNSRQDYH